MGKICVVGLGYIGLPTAAVFASAGFDVVGVDTNPRVVKALQRGKITIKEVGLAEQVAEVVSNGKLRASLYPRRSEVFIISVPTPIKENQKADLGYVVTALSSILHYLEKGNLIIVESTVPPRTIDDVIAPILIKAGFNPAEDVYLAHCPERVLPGRILIELVENCRIVGGYTTEAAKKAGDVYRSIVWGEVIETDALTAEMTKLMENTYRDVNIALANELVKVAKKLKVNAYEVIQLANRHPRVNIHSPGPGVGGHCLAVDPYFIVEKAQEEAKLISLAREVNSSMPHFVAEQVEELTAHLHHAKIAVLGLTYKANIDDIRESPALEVFYLLNQNEKYDVFAHDPYVKEEAVHFPLYSFAEAVSDADIAVVLVEHQEFCYKNDDEWKVPIVLDCKNCLKDDLKGVKRYQLGHNDTDESYSKYRTLK